MTKLTTKFNCQRLRHNHTHSLHSIPTCTQKSPSFVSCNHPSKTRARVTSQPASTFSLINPGLEELNVTRSTVDREAFVNRVLGD
ncbi:hypothetical protein ACFX1W_006656 [Malus domestica]